MRDLKADLEWMFSAPSDHAKELEIAVHALERAIEAETLARELAETLEVAHGEMYARYQVGISDRITGLVLGVLQKAKEVLGDEQSNDCRLI